MFVVFQQIQHFLLQELLGCNVKLVKQRFQTFYSIGLLFTKSRYYIYGIVINKNKGPNHLFHMGRIMCKCFENINHNPSNKESSLLCLFGASRNGLFLIKPQVHRQLVRRKLPSEILYGLSHCQFSTLFLKSKYFNSYT